MPEFTYDLEKELQRVASMTEIIYVTEAYTVLASWWQKLSKRGAPLPSISSEELFFRLINMIFKWQPKISNQLGRHVDKKTEESCKACPSLGLMQFVYGCLEIGNQRNHADDFTIIRAHIR